MVQMIMIAKSFLRLSMLIAFDVGNTNIVIGVCMKKLVGYTRLQAMKER